MFWVISLLTGTIDTICGDEVMLTRHIVSFCAELIKGLCLAWSARCSPCVAVLQAGKLSRHALEMWLALLLARKFFGLYGTSTSARTVQLQTRQSSTGKRAEVTEQFSVTHCDIEGSNCVRPTL